MAHLRNHLKLVRPESWMGMGVNLLTILLESPDHTTQGEEEPTSPSSVTSPSPTMGVRTISESKEKAIQEVARRFNGEFTAVEIHRALKESDLAWTPTYKEVYFTLARAKWAHKTGTWSRQSKYRYRGG